MSTYRGDVVFDHVTSGCVWSGDSYGVSRNGSQTSGVVYISGVRLPVSAVSAHLFTASKDTYIDINGSGVQVYTEATNNAASPALTAGSVRIGIIITGATTIAAATSVNQGQESMVLPIASSIPYAVTDSLGNLICPRDPNRKVLGYRRDQGGTSTASTSFVDYTGLNLTVNVPTGRKVKLTAVVPVGFNGVSGSGGDINIFDVTAGVQLNEAIARSAAINGEFNITNTLVYTPPASGVRNFKVQLKAVVSGTFTTSATSTLQPNILVELV